HVGDLLNEWSEHLEGFGGRAGAGGGTIREGEWDGFVQSFGKAILRQAETADDHLVQSIDGKLGLGAMPIGLAERLARFEPFGNGNPACTWLLEDVHIADRRDLKGGVVRLKLSDGARWLDGIVFGAGALDAVLQRGQVVSLIGQLKRDDWRGNGAVQFVVEDALTSN
ncbi:MAG: single-stranded-DNA-specific exonuclease RecJ, partial [bacterium]